MGRRAAKALVLFVFFAGLQLCRSSCEHEVEEMDPTVSGDGQVAGANFTTLEDGRPAWDDITLNTSRLYYYENFNVTTMNQPETYRKVIISLEPCEGVVYLLVRKTRRCWPDPRSCCQPLPGNPNSSAAPPCDPARYTVKCDWTHFHSILDGSRDGAPTFFEVPHSSTKYYISVFAPLEANLNNSVVRPRYRLTVLADIGAYPRPGLQGRLEATLAGDRAVQVSWYAATFAPVGISTIRYYHIYSSPLLDTDDKQNEAVFLTPAKVMNSVCGLSLNAVRYGAPLTTVQCVNDLCSATVSDLIPSRRYMLNVVAESYRGFNASYSGIIVSSDWSETRSAFTGWSESAKTLVSAIIGTVFGVLGIGYIWIVKLYK